MTRRLPLAGRPRKAPRLLIDVDYSKLTLLTLLMYLRGGRDSGR